MASDFIDTAAAAIMLSVTTRTVLNLRRSGRLPFQKENQGFLSQIACRRAFEGRSDGVAGEDLDARCA